MTPFKPNGELPPDNNHSGNGGGSSNPTSKKRIEEIAATKDNPKLWLTKYEFYTDVLEMSHSEAMRWADVDVSINTEVRQKWGIPPAKSLLQDAI